MPSRVGIERRNANETMDPHLRLQLAVNVLAVDLNSSGLDTRAFALEPIRDNGVEFVPLGPSQVHAQEHLSPILAFGSPCARVYRHNGIACVILTRKQHARLKLLQLSF